MVVVVVVAVKGVKATVLQVNIISNSRCRVVVEVSCSKIRCSNSMVDH